MKIEKNIPLKNHSSTKKYFWNELQVGDSVFFKTDQPIKKAKLLWQSYNLYTKKHSPTTKFTSAKVDGGVRIWRVK